MIDPNKLVQLQQLTGLRFRAAQSEMSVLLDREAALRSNLDQLVKTRRAQSQAARATNEAALVAGADIRWHRWVDQRRAVINHELAQVLAQKAACHAMLQKAFGKDQATQALQKKAKAAADQTAARRVAYES